MSRKKPDLADTVNAYAKLNAEIDGLKEQQKALADRAYVNGLVQAGSEANARKVVAQLAKELDWEAERRASQAQLELALDQGRVTLGIAAEPSGDAGPDIPDMPMDPFTAGSDRQRPN